MKTPPRKRTPRSIGLAPAPTRREVSHAIASVRHATAGVQEALSHHAQQLRVLLPQLSAACLFEAFVGAGAEILLESAPQAAVAARLRALAAQLEAQAAPRAQAQRVSREIRRTLARYPALYPGSRKRR